MKPIRGVTGLCAGMLAVSLLWAASASDASLVTLTNKNSSAGIDTASQAGVFDWVVNGTDVMSKQWFWYRVGSSGAESNIAALTTVTVGPSSSGFDGSNIDTLFLRYTNSVQKFVVEITLALTGGSPGSKTSDLYATIKLKNTGTSALDFHFFEYCDLNLNGAANDIVSFLNPSTVTQTNSANGAYFNAVATSAGSRHEANLFSGTYTSLTNSTASTLSDANGPMTGDATWAYEWDVNIAAGTSYTILVDHLVIVPEPSSLMLGLAGLFLLALAMRRTGLTRAISKGP